VKLPDLPVRSVLPDVVAALDEGRLGDAFELLLDRLANAETDEREGIRALMVALFGELGPEHPLAVQYRRRLATALY